MHLFSIPFSIGFSIPFSIPFSIRGLLTMTILLASGEAHAAPAPGGELPELELRMQAEFHRWWYGTYRGSYRVEQTYLPVDLSYSPNPSFTGSAGIDLASSSRRGVGPSGNLDGLGELRLSIETSWLEDRLRLSLGSLHSLYEGDLLPREVRAAEAIELMALELPWPRPGAGTRLTLAGAAQILRRPGFLAQLGGSYERRGSYDLRADGLRFDPGDVARLGGSLHGVLGTVGLRVAAAVEDASESRLSDGPAYRLGPGASLTLGAALPLGVHQLRAEVSVSGRGHGEVESGALLQPSLLRGGNRLRWEAAWGRGFGPWEVELSLAGTSLRGFAGDLGHADWIAPGGSLRHAFWGGSLGLGLETPFGHGRSGRDLSGVRASLSWAGALLQ